jgi:POT family proton-dependent oligopeptide transporter
MVVLYPQGDIRRDKDLVFYIRTKHKSLLLNYDLWLCCLRNGDVCQFWFWLLESRNGVEPYGYLWGWTKYLTQVGNLEAQETAVVDESSYSTLFKNLLKSQTQLFITIAHIFPFWMNV